MPCRQTCEEGVGRDVYEGDRCRLGEQAVGYRLCDADAGDLLDERRQALQVLNVKCSMHMDAGVQEGLDVLPALLETGAPGVRVGEFVEEQRVAGDRLRGVEIENVCKSELFALVEPRQAVEERFRLRAPVGEDVADDDPLPACEPCSCIGQHREGLPHAGRHAEEDRQAPARRTAGNAIGGEHGHRGGACFSRSAAFNASTFTRGTAGGNEQVKGD